MSQDTKPKPTDLPPIFALIIGINKYMCPEVTDLNGAVGDADDFESFLTTKLNVPDQNIINLRDEQATRDNILAGFISLRNNPTIRKNEAAIIIYYAGHGSRTDTPEEWGEEWITPDGKIEMLCPSDVWTSKFDENREVMQVPGIHDRTISVLLNQISSEKGDNITLILDCCSSAGINRIRLETPPEDNDYTVRYAHNPIWAPLQPQCDYNISAGGNRSASVPQSLNDKYHASHVLLAACGRNQIANEGKTNKRGVFTHALLEILNNFDPADLTYTSVMHRIQMPTDISMKQIPHCQGQNVNRRLFNRKALGADSSYLLTRREEDGSIKLQAGLAQGITPGTIFTVHHSNLLTTDNNYSNPDMGHLHAITVNPLESRLEILRGSPVTNLPHLFYCRVKRLADRVLNVYSNDRPWIDSVFSAEQQDSVKICDSPEESDIEMIVDKGQVFFYQNNKLVTPHIDRKLPQTVEMGNTAMVREVAQAALTFMHHLTRGGDNMQSVWMELKKLRVEVTKDYDEVHKPHGDNLIENDPATIAVDEQERFGMTIFNQSDVPLYPSLFYFEPSDFSITEWYTPAFGAGSGNNAYRVDPPLPPKSAFTMGYGEGNVPPWQFMLRDGETKDVGFFKLYLTTQATNMSNIAQDSPFIEKTTRYGKAANTKVLETARWASQMITVIQVAPEVAV